MTETASRDNAAWRLECVGVSVRSGGRTVLHDVNLTLRPGESVCLIGPNGAGKTTLMQVLLGLLPPVAGRVQLDGLALHRLGARRRGRFAAYVPQVVEHIPAFQVRDVVAGGRYAHVPPLRPLSDLDQAAIEGALQQCGLREVAQRPINAISGGERQKALLAAAIAQDAQVMFLDEPNTALDPAYQVELLELLRTWHRRGRGLVLISHDLYLPMIVGGRVIALRGGRVVSDGPVSEVLQPARLSEIYDTQFETATTADGRRVVLPRWWRSPQRA